MKTGRRDAAAQYFGAITSGSPGRSVGWALLGDALLQAGKGQEAEKNYRRALSLDPFDLTALRGLDHLKQKDLISPEIARNLPF